MSKKTLCAHLPQGRHRNGDHRRHWQLSPGNRCDPERPRFELRPKAAWRVVGGRCAAGVVTGIPARHPALCAGAASRIDELRAHNIPMFGRILQLGVARHAAVSRCGVRRRVLAAGNERLLQTRVLARTDPGRARRSSARWYLLLGLLSAEGRRDYRRATHRRRANSTNISATPPHGSPITQ